MTGGRLSATYGVVQQHQGQALWQRSVVARVAGLVAVGVFIAGAVVGSAADFAVPASAATLDESQTIAPFAGTLGTAAGGPAGYPGGGVVAFGDAPTGDPLEGITFNSPVVAMVATNTGQGYWLAGADGGIYTVGNAGYFGSLGNLNLIGPVVGMAATPDDKGYWLVALDGGVFAFGDARFYGSMGGRPLNEPIVGMAATPTGGGYWLVAADGGLFAFGNAQFYGSMGGQPLDAPIVGMATTPSGAGYWLVAADGGIFTYGDAGYFGSHGGSSTLQSGIVGMAPTSTGGGYWLLEWDGQVFSYGTAPTYGSPTSSPSASPFSAIVPSHDDEGYWLLDSDDFAYSFANPPPSGGDPGIVAAAATQIGPDPLTGRFCNPYGPCEEWCALFATWAWRQTGVPIPSYAFTGDVFDWSAAYGSVLSSTQTPVAGDIVLYGTGPQTVTSSVHDGIVAQVWPDGAVVTIEGDAGPGDAGHLAVVLNGPFLPADSGWYNGVSIYAFAQP